MRVYIKKIENICLLQGQVCDYIGKPKCKSCELYLEFKKSGKTIREFEEEHRITSY